MYDTFTKLGNEEFQLQLASEITSLCCLILSNLPAVLSCTRGFGFHVLLCSGPNPTTYHNIGNVFRPLTFRGNIPMIGFRVKFGVRGFRCWLHLKLIVCNGLLYHFDHYPGMRAISVSLFKPTVSKLYRKLSKVTYKEPRVLSD